MAITICHSTTVPEKLNSFATELKKPCTDIFSEDWDGHAIELDISSMIREGGSSSYASCIAIGGQAEKSYAASAFRLSMFWEPVVYSAFRSEDLSAWSEINAMLSSDQLSTRSKSWILLHIMKIAEGRSWSWIDENNLLQITKSMMQKRFLVYRYKLAVDHGDILTSERGKDGKILPPKIIKRQAEIREWDIDSVLLAIAVLSDVFPIDIPRHDLSLLFFSGKPYPLGINSAIRSVTESIPIMEERIKTRESLAHILMNHELSGIDSGTAERFAHSYADLLRPDPMTAQRVSLMTLDYLDRANSRNDVISRAIAHGLWDYLVDAFRRNRFSARRGISQEPIVNNAAILDQRMSTQVIAPTETEMNSTEQFKVWVRPLMNSYLHQTDRFSGHLEREWNAVIKSVQEWTPSK